MKPLPNLRKPPASPPCFAALLRRPASRTLIPCPSHAAVAAVAGCGIKSNHPAPCTPLGGGQVADTTRAQVLDQARRMAANLKDLGFEPGARLAILSKNCANFIMAELAHYLHKGLTGNGYVVEERG